MNKSINLSLVCLLIIPILSVLCNDLDGIAYAQLLSHSLSKKVVSSQTPAGQIRSLLENAVLEVSNSKALATINLVDLQLPALGNPSLIQTLRVIMKDSAGLLQVGSVDKALVPLDQASAPIISHSRPISSNATGSIVQCIVIPGPAMSFREVCPNGNNATTPGSSAVQARPQTGPRTPFSASAPALPSARAPITPLLPLKQPPITVNPPLIPAYNNTKILSLFQDNPRLTSSSSPGPPSLLNAKTFRTYNSTLYGVSIQYPSNWTIEEGDNFLFGSAVTNIATFVPPWGLTGSRDYHTYAAISIEPSKSTSLAAYLNNVINQYSRLPGFSKTGSSIGAILAGSPAYILQYRDIEPGYPVKAVEVGTKIGDKVYFISYTADPKIYSVYLPNVYTMIRSLSINSGNTVQNPVNAAQNNFNPTHNSVPPGDPGALGSIPK